MHAVLQVFVDTNAADRSELYRMAGSQVQVDVLFPEGMSFGNKHKNALFAVLEVCLGMLILEEVSRRVCLLSMSEALPVEKAEA